MSPVRGPNLLKKIEYLWGFKVCLKVLKLMIENM